MNTLSVIKTRKSPDAFNTSPIKDEDLKVIAEAGNYAPIFGKVDITVVKNPELLDLISTAALDMMKNDAEDPMGFNMANVSCAAENMILAATDLGIGSRFMMGPIMALTVEPVKSKLAIPDGFKPLIAVALGNIDEGFAERTKDMSNIRYI